MLLAACTLLLLLGAAPAQSAPSGRTLLQGGGKTTKNRMDNSLRAAVATSDSILLAVRKGGGAGINSATKDGMALARMASSASAAPSDFAPGGDKRRRLLQLQHDLAAKTRNTRANALDNERYGNDSAKAVGGGLAQRIARKLLQGKKIGSNTALSTWSVMSAAEAVQAAALGGAQLMAVLDATQWGNKLSRQVSSRCLDPSDFDIKRASP